MALILISLGVYLINWLYQRNIDFEKVDTDAPDAKRGAIIMFFIPSAWFLIIWVLKLLFFEAGNHFIGILEIVVWGIIIVLIAKYILDFCICFGRITKTNGLFWFLLYLIGGIGFISIFFKFYFTIPLIFFLIISVPAMQAELNSHFLKIHMRKEKRIYYN
ncbi:hypothetical protein EOM09_05890 [bacterium]|nr:hypothetical protein [bacterium]